MSKGSRSFLKKRTKKLLVINTVGQVLHWWVGELAGLVPHAAARWLFGSGVVLPVRLDGDWLHFDASPLPRDAAVLPPSLRDRIALADSVVLILPATLALRRTIDLPAVAARDLNHAVPFLVERHTPFQPGQARAAWRIASPKDASGKIRLELAVTAAAPLDTILAKLQRLDVLVGAIHLDGDESQPKLDFAAAANRHRMRSYFAEPWRPLLAGALALLLVGPIVVAGAVHLRARAMEQALAARGAPPQESERLRARLQADIILAGVLATRAAEPGALETLQRVTQALPDSSWLFALDATPQTLQLGGFSTDMPAAVARLQAVPAVAKLEFRSPVIHDARADRDRFDILLRLKKATDAP